MDMSQHFSIPHCERKEWGSLIGNNLPCSSTVLFGLLVVVKEDLGLTQSAVAKALASDRSSIAGAVDRLEQMNLITRRRSKKIKDLMPRL